VTTGDGGGGSGCPKREMCEVVFSHISFAPSAGVMRALYCETRFQVCARFLRAESGLPVPPTLRPDGSERRTGG